MISTAILLLVVLAGVVIGGLVSQSGGFGGPTKVAVVAGASGAAGSAGLEAALGESFEVTEVAVNERLPRSSCATVGRRCGDCCRR